MSARPKLAGWLIGALAFAAAAPAARATTAVEVRSIEALSRSADAVVHGEVGEMYSVREGDQIFTYIDVGVREPLKGGGRADTVTLKLYGGEVDGVRTRVVGAPCLSAGEEVVLFLRPNSATTYGVVELAQGKFRVTRAENGTAQVERDLTGIQFLRQSPDLAPTTLAELAEAVRAASK